MRAGITRWTLLAGSLTVRSAQRSVAQSESAGLRLNGLMALDNQMWHNWMLDAQNQHAEPVGIRECNSRATVDGRVDCVMVHVSEGPTLARNHLTAADGPASRIRQSRARTRGRVLRGC